MLVKKLPSITAILRLVIIVTYAFLLFPFQSKMFSQVYLNPSATIENRVNDLLSRMTLDEKIGQMVLTEAGYNNASSVVKNYYLGAIMNGLGNNPKSNTVEGWVKMYNNFQDSALATRLKIPILYGTDAIHGHGAAYGSVIFPHNIGLGCTRDTEIVKLCARATAIEVKATGLNWIFGPNIGIARDIRWGRTLECFGETPELQATMAYAAVKGIQGDSLGEPLRILACAKHFIADGGTAGGVNAGDTKITEKELRTIYLPGYIKAIEAGVGSIMLAPITLNGIQCHASKFLITDLLKDEMGFKGIVAADWQSIDAISTDLKTAIKIGINAGIDIAHQPTNPLIFIAKLKELVTEDSVKEDRINDAVKRILTIKFKMGLFEKPKANLAMTDSFGKYYHRAIARRAVRESQVLLKNNGLIPLSKNMGKILVAGNKANDIGSQCGGWTIEFKGKTGDITTGTTILKAIQNVRGAENVVYNKTGSVSEEFTSAIVVVGENPYAESNSNNSSLGLPEEDISVLKNIKQLKIPYVVFLLSGRPLLIQNEIKDASAFVASWLPGTEAAGITDVLFGDFQFTGKLSYTWPASIDQIPLNANDSIYKPLFPYGYGLTRNVNLHK